MWGGGDERRRFDPFSYRKKVVLSRKLCRRRLSPPPDQQRNSNSCNFHSKPENPTYLSLKAEKWYLLVKVAQSLRFLALFPIKKGSRLRIKKDVQHFSVIAPSVDASLLTPSGPVSRLYGSAPHTQLLTLTSTNLQCCRFASDRADNGKNEEYAEAVCTCPF